MNNGFRGLIAFDSPPCFRYYEVIRRLNTDLNGQYKKRRVMPPEEGNNVMSKDFLMMEAGTVNRGEAKALMRTGGVTGYKGAVPQTPGMGQGQDQEPTR